MTGDALAPRAGFVCLVGRPNVGKSTLANALVGQKVAIVSDKPQTTRHRILAVAHLRGGQIALYDTPGIHKPLFRMNRRMVAAATRSLSHADLALWLVDATEGYGPGDRYVRQILKRSGRPVMLAINKIDAVKKPRILPVIEQYRTLLDFVEVVPVSALSGDNVALLGERLLTHLPESAPLYPDDFLSDRPQRFFVSELVREQVLRHTRQEIPHATGVLIESFAVEPKLVRIQAAILVERESQKGIMIGKAGALLKTIGSAARREIEDFLGAHVFLGLLVKVRREWREDPRALDQMDVVETDLTAG